MILPTKVEKAENRNPSKLVIIGHQGCGKTSLVAALPNCLLVDLEGGSATIDGIKVDIKGIGAKENKTDGKVFNEVIESIKVANAEKGDFVYDFIAFDTLTSLEAIAVKKATAEFKTSVIGKGMINKGATITDVVADLPEGAGYRFLYNAFNSLYDQCLRLARYGVIFIGHTKQGALMKNGQKIEARDMALTGKLKLDLLRDVDACGYVWRDNNNLVITFKVNETDLTTKSRCAHLRNEEFVISSLNPETNEFTFNWNKIYLNTVKEPIIVKHGINK